MTRKRRTTDGYYHSEYGSARRERPTGGVARALLVVADSLMMALTILAALGLIAGMLAKVVDPRSTAIFTLAGLFFQVVYYLNIVAALWWVVRWRKWFLVSGAMLLLGAGNIALFYRPDFASKASAVERTRDDIVLVSYNVANFLSPDQKTNRYEDIVEWLNGQGASIVALQEAQFSDSQTLTQLRNDLSRINYSIFVNAIPEQKDSSTGAGYALLSTWPIVRHGVADSDASNVNAIWADVKMGRDTLRIFNVHLQSTGITDEERHETLSMRIIDDRAAGEKLSLVAAKMGDNYRHRASEAESVAAAVEASPHPVILCGDFNDTPVSYTYRTMRGRRLDDAYLSCGRGVEHTFRGLFDLFRIDYIFPEGDHFDIKEYASYDLELSDHKPLVCRVLLIEEE